MHQRATDVIPSLIYALGFSWRKRALLRQFLGGIDIRFIRNTERLPENATIAVWASGPFGLRAPEDAPVRRFAQLFVEDGFLRSVGLGADLVRPLSWVVDRRGIYYDSSRISDLEQRLQSQPFDEFSLGRAAALRTALVSTGLTKYNVGAARWKRPPRAAHREIILVPGQVETDASLLFGAPGIKTNLALLKCARQAHPDAWLIYKPHPDVTAKLRGSAVQEELAAPWCDEVVTDVSMGDLLTEVDQMHVMTSLAGFEGLIRGKKVVCHGLPFYAGWGLTHDVHASPRRTRKLTIDQLVAAALIEYPLYANGRTGEICQVEQAFSELLKWRAKSDHGLPVWRRLMRPLIRRA